MKKTSTKRIQILAIIVALFMSTSAYTQTVLLKSDKGGRGYMATGMQFLNVSSLNTELTDYGYPEVSDYLVSIGGGGEYIHDKWVIGGEGHSYIGNTNSQNSVNTSLMMGYGMGKIGYKVIEDYLFELYPSIGIGGGGMSLEIYEDQQPAFDDILNDPARTTTLTTAGWLVDIGVNTVFNIGMTDNAERNIYSRGGFILGISAGYMLSPFENDWQLHDQDISRGPDVNMDGFYIRLKIGGGGYTRYDNIDGE